MHRQYLWAALAGLLGCSARASAEGSQVKFDSVRKAVAKSIPLLEQGSSGSADKRTCFTCHNQAVPVLALAEARRRGLPIDSRNLKRQLNHTAAFLKRGQKNYLQGKGQGGKVLTAGYALWTLEAGGHPADETTAAVTDYLLEYQRDANHWSHGGRRPPSSGSDFTATYVALRGLDAFGTDEQQTRIERRRATITQWLREAAPKETEDRVFRLRSLKYVEGGKELAEKAAVELIESQQEDGGWAQLDQSKSDAYATGTVLVALLRSGHLNAKHPAAQRAVHYLLGTQMDDGSWHVATRADGFQTYFESGFPHGKDQFISIAASSWATLGLLLMLPDEG